MSRFTADWLALREPADAAARDRMLARRFAALLPRNATILDFGAGTGANARFLAPVIAGDQHWLLVERDPALCAAQREAMLAWASRSGLEAVPDDGGVVVSAQRGAWRFASFALDLADGWDALEDAAADATTASALFDLASTDWIEQFAAWLGRRGLPLLATLMVDGRRLFLPQDTEDDMVGAAFLRHQGGDKGLGPAAGPAAWMCLERALAARGYAVDRAASDWRLGPAEGDLLGAIVAGSAEAAREAAPDAARRIDGWERRRGSALRSAALTATIGHRDLLAWQA